MSAVPVNMIAQEVTASVEMIANRTFCGTALIVAAERLGFSCRLAALANATHARSEIDSKTQKSRDLERRKAVSWNPMLGRRFGAVQRSI
jgi:hypothetical protein